MSKLYLFARSCFPNPKGYCHRTILMRGKDADDATMAVRHRVKEENSIDYIGVPKEVNYDRS